MRVPDVFTDRAAGCRIVEVHRPVGRLTIGHGPIPMKAVDTLLAPRWRVDGLSAVTSTPAVVKGVVYFGDWSGVVHARRASDGTELWSRQLGSAIRPSPLVTRDRVYVPESNGQLHALRRDTGDIVWSAVLDTQPLLSIDSSPAAVRARTPTSARRPTCSRSGGARLWAWGRRTASITCSIGRPARRSGRCSSPAGARSAASW